MNPSNALTLSRLAMGLVLPFFLTFPIPFGKSLGLLIFLLAALTDYWDGRLARNKYGTTVFGQLMDPLADKVLMGAAFICFVALDQIVPAWIVVIIITREFMVTGLRLLGASQGKIISAGRWGKHKTIWQIVVITVIIFGMALRDDILPLFLRADGLQQYLISFFNPLFRYVTMGIAGLVTLLTVISGTIYFWRCKDWVMEDA
ncbi:MAG: CDP-diacylglycerol--glycerol-3-phosphate 3-phosphatidyltransferase [Verrucomicrobia bacterium]|nr:CDP-diacylglycerol--glycerol-3-phosphate 3-phosphatidyltransferase [Verrucomicrobiota bacterium]MBU4427799.1 CDP-diacylglycerol--glycerol-3-phosphate 3-phosphatidyltransferase [Verrucomicrobiota bacterium]MCG2681374.1 CDP-diacylglycerol--glycerol-3-phosphate 3-phosphatidyltransferase [Kiritimatiellia bacterium]